MTQPDAQRWRNIAIVGPYWSGKTTVLESLLSVTNAISRKGSISQGNTVGDSNPQARAREMGVEVNVAGTEYEDIRFTFLDCPGSIEFAQETYNALVGVDAAVVVCEPDKNKAITLAPLFKFLDDWQIPHLVFINKMDLLSGQGMAVGEAFMETLHALNKVSTRPLLPQQYPIGQNEKIIGYIDLIREQAYHYHEQAPADLVPLPQDLEVEEHMARQEMLEGLADFDDRLLEELLEDVEPSQKEVIDDLKKELSADYIVPVLCGIAVQDYGVRPLLDILKQESPAPSITAERRGLKSDSKPVAQVLKTYYTQQGGKLSLVRIWQGSISESTTFNNGVRSHGMYRLMGQQQTSLNEAHAGETIALGRLEDVHTGDVLVAEDKKAPQLPQADALQPVYAIAITPVNRKDEVKISSALSKLTEEDPALKVEQREDTHEIILWGQGEIHLQVTQERLEQKYKLPTNAHIPQVPYRETIRKPVSGIRGRYKHQSGGHGQYGDVYLDIKPLERGSGFQFSETIVGGSVPKQYIPGVEMGVREYLQQGPLGFPVVDVAVTLTDGSYHSVDSSEQAFKFAARVAMTEGMPKAQPQLLEPVYAVDVFAPQEYTSNVLQLVGTRRGQIMGYEPVMDWKGWDKISVYLPQVEMQNLIVQLRSLTLGVGYFASAFDHLQEVPDKIAEKILVTHEDNGGQS
ncbi:elongation factor G [Geitlerinema sp. PCC 9228]|jgi:elongation factor G|uniref:elongation factor G n=1 Tax=Geitlerinema sp. PCC 9228 TaxID=111611 RepID=UPI0008F9B624|nr:elongation factor G [Geitlerinema sp. PCC 9228]